MVGPEIGGSLTNGGGIYQRVGRGRGSRVRTLFAFAPEARIRPNLDFFENAAAVVGRRFEPIFATAFDRAVRTAR